MNNPMDTAGAATTALSIGSVVAAEAMSPHPMQLAAWGVAILSGLVAIVLGCIRVYKAAKE
jgi:hypothetical protein